MTNKQLLDQINLRLDALEALILSIEPNINPDLVSLDTRIESIAGILTAKIDPPQG